MPLLELFEFECWFGFESMEQLVCGLPLYPKEVSFGQGFVFIFTLRFT